MDSSRHPRVRSRPTARTLPHSFLATLASPMQCCASADWACTSLTAKNTATLQNRLLADPCIPGIVACCTQAAFPLGAAGRPRSGSAIHTGPLLRLEQASSGASLVPPPPNPPYSRRVCSAQAFAQLGHTASPPRAESTFDVSDSLPDIGCCCCSFAVWLDVIDEHPEVGLRPRPSAGSKQ